MAIHIYYRNGKEETVVTNRVTFQRNALLLGTLPHFKTILMEEIDWYWIEEE